MEQPIVPGFLRPSQFRIYDNQSGSNRLTDTPQPLESNIVIRKRGSSSLAFPKNNYGIEFRDEVTDEDIEVSPFGMPKHDDWALHGPYSDKSLMRNALAYTWAARFTPWAPRSKFVDVVINDSYEGVYLFTERVDRDNDRVDIAKLKPDDVAGVDLTGGYMLQIGDDQAEEFRSFFSEYSQVEGMDVFTQYRLDYPKWDSVQPVQWDYIRNYVRGVENRIAQPSYLDARTGYRNEFDIASWVDFAIMQELSGNFDAYRRSTWVVKDRDDEGGRFAAGPAWDFNIAFGNEEICMGQTTDGWVTQSSGGNCDFASLPFFVQRMWDDPVFKARLRARWEGLRQNVLSPTRINSDIDSLVALLSPVQPADQRRWENIGTYVWPNAFVGDTWASEVAYLREWIRGRAAWLDTNVKTLPTLASLQDQLTSLPIVRVEVAGNAAIPAGRIDASLQVIDNGDDQFNSPEGSSTGYNGNVAIELKGSDGKKPSYAFELRDSEGEDYAYRLLDLPKEEDWVLQASYSDKTLSRDLLAYRLAKETRIPYTRRARQVVLYVNGSYDGVYTLSEAVKRDDSRIDIAKLNPDELSGDDLTGGYILRVDGPSGDLTQGFVSTYANSAGQDDRTFYEYHTPDAEDIVPAQRSYIEAEIREFEDAISSGGFAAVRQRIDVASFVDYMLVQELVASSRAYRREGFLYKDKDSNGGKLTAGPIVDVERGFGNDTECGGTNFQKWVVLNNSRCSSSAQIPFWWSALWLDQSFRISAASRWKELRQGAFTNGMLRAMVATATAEASLEASSNFERYPILGIPVERNAFVGQTYAEEVNYLSQWLLGRAAWMDANIDIVNSVHELAGPAGLSVSPNPGTGANKLTLTFDTEAALGHTVEVAILDGLGRSVLQQAVAAGQERIELSVSQLPHGIYYVRLRADGKQLGLVKWVR